MKTSTMDLKEIIESTIINNSTHRHYEHVTKLSQKYRAFITNEPITTKDRDGKSKEEYPLNQYLRQFVRREDDDLFEQRKNLTKHYTPSICAQIMKPFNKVIRSNRVVKLIDHKDANVVNDLEETLVKFYGESDNNGVDQFLSERFLPLTFTDPNAWLWITFNPFDGKKEKPQTFPIEYSSEAVVNYEIKNDKTNWVIVKLLYEFQKKDNSNDKAERFLIFGDMDTIEYKLIPEDIKEPFVKANDVIWVHPNTKRKYAVYTYNHKSNRVPLMRVGYRKDIFTKSETFVNPFHYEAMPLLEQFIKVSSELQLSITLHAFPKQVSYVSVCEAKGCNGGKLSDGIAECLACKGTGKKVHTTSADIQEIPMPKRPEDMVDVSGISTYVPFPGGVMEFLDRYADKLEDKIMRKVFNSESIVQVQFNSATEATFDMDSVYDTLHPFGDKFSEVWMFFVKLTVLYRNYKDVIIWHKFPSDLKLKSLKQLLEELKTANDSGASSYIRESINNDIADIIYADDQSERAKLAIKNKHFPFSGKTDFEIQNIIMNNLTTQYKQILYANFDSIFDDLENENQGFYDMTYVKQKDLIKAKVDLIITEINSSKVKTLDLDLKIA